MVGEMEFTGNTIDSCSGYDRKERAWRGDSAQYADRHAGGSAGLGGTSCDAPGGKKKLLSHVMINSYQPMAISQSNQARILFLKSSGEHSTYTIAGNSEGLAHREEVERKLRRILNE